MPATLIPPRTRPSATTPTPRVWTVDEFHQLGDEGKFEGRRAMLIDGVILEHGPVNTPHAVAGEKTEEAIRRVFGPGWRVRSQKPLILGRKTDPEPDVAVIRGTPTLVGGHPTTADLVIEISDSSLRFDKTVKLSLYAAAGIPDYWVVDLANALVLVYRDPVPDAKAPHGATYRTETTYRSGDAVTPLSLPAAATVAVADLLP